MMSKYLALPSVEQASIPEACCRARSARVANLFARSEEERMVVFHLRREVGQPPTQEPKEPYCALAVAGVAEAGAGGR